MAAYLDFREPCQAPLSTPMSTTPSAMPVPLDWHTWRGCCLASCRCVPAASGAGGPAQLLFEESLRAAVCGVTAADALGWPTFLAWEAEVAAMGIK